MSAAQTSTNGQPAKHLKLEKLHVPADKYSYAFGYISRGHSITIERLEALLEHPGRKSDLLKTIKSIHDDLVDEVVSLRSKLELDAATKTGGAA
jgi:hypothetical protein